MQNTTILGATQLIELLVSLALIVIIILQAKGTGLGSLFGGDTGMGITKTRRGLEKTLFQVTIILGALFLGISIIQLMLQKS